MFENYRHPGEFEPQSDVFMTWLPDDIQMQGYDNRATCVEIIKALQCYGDAKLHINCGAEGVLDRARAILKNADVNINNIEFTQFADTNWYVRDNGPTIMVDDQGGRLMINPGWSYYGVWQEDSPEAVCARKAGVHMAVSLGCYDILNSALVSEGGDREFNGDGVMMCIEDTEVRKRNPGCTKEQVEKEYKRIYHVDKIIWIPQPMVEDDDYRIGPLEYRGETPYFGTSFAAHIDEMCRFINRTTVLLAEVSDDEAAASAAAAENKHRLDAAYEILSGATDAHGERFTILRMPTSFPIDYVLSTDDGDYELYKGFIDDMGGCFADGTPWPEGDLHFIASTSYCNFLICNGVVVGQRYWNEGMDTAIKSKDEQAEAVLKVCFPGRQVVMVDSLALNMSGGGVHCWTKNVPVASAESQARKESHHPSKGQSVSSKKSNQFIVERYSNEQ